MRIVTSTSFEDGTRAINSAAEALAQAQRQIASGRRIGTPSEDPLGSATAITEHAAIDRIDGYSSATSAAKYRLSVADSVLSDVVDQLTAAQSTALSARGTTATAGQRTAAANELLAMRDALMGDINTQVQGSYLFSGSKVTTAPFAPGSAYQGDTGATSVDIANSRAVANTFDGGQIFQGSDSQHVLDVLTNLATAVLAGDDAAITSGTDALKRAFDRATAAQARVGNDLRTTDDVSGQLVALRQHAAARVSSIEDVNIAEASTRLAQADTAYRAALAAMATVGRVSLMDYLK